MSTSARAILVAGILAGLVGILASSQDYPLGPRALPLPQRSPVAIAPLDAEFDHVTLFQSGSVLAENGACLVRLEGSTPPLLTLDRYIDAALGPGRQLRVYGGWPRDEAGDITGVTNVSGDPPGTRVVESKLGPTVVWVVAGCERLCISAVVLRYTVVATRDGRDYPLLRIKSPTLDGGPKVDCLDPTFEAPRSLAESPMGGVIDQPGSTISDIGDAFRTVDGQLMRIRADDAIRIEFRQRVFIECDGRHEAMVDWGYVLAGPLGAPAHELRPDVLADLAFDLALRDDPDPIRRRAFRVAVAELAALRAADSAP